MENAIAAALDGGKAATFAKNEAEAELDEIITQIAVHGESVVSHDEALIYSAGFDVRKPTPIGDLKAPSNLRADLTDKVGEIQADWGPPCMVRTSTSSNATGEPLIEANWLCWA
ncbi:MAG: hypothetical protein IPI81_04030 [Flavobacteriales bacterium]|nr:hypothetical protein [Flavobacteriales bacterium]